MKLLKSASRVAAGLGVAGVLFVVAALAESVVRERSAKDQIYTLAEGAPQAGVALVARSQPDLLWSGTKYTVTILNQSLQPLEECLLEVSGSGRFTFRDLGYEGDVLPPAGTLVLYHSHDRSNVSFTGEWGRGMPDRITLLTRHGSFVWDRRK